MWTWWTCTEIDLFAILIKFSEGKENDLCRDFVLYGVFVKFLSTPDSHEKLVSIIDNVCFSLGTASSLGVLNTNFLFLIVSGKI